MKLIATGDVHGRDFWRSIAGTQAFDKLVILGDYFDSPNIGVTEQMDNFIEIITFKKANPDKVVLLTGNHDFHYLPGAIQVNERYSGFQDRYVFQISQLLQEHLDQLKMCFQWNNYLFTHAGVTNTWLKNTGYSEEPVDEYINKLFRYNPGKFLFNGSDPYGDNITQSPIWVRPASLKKNAYKYETIKQVVGHTTMMKLQIAKDRFFFIDTSGTSREYLVLTDGSPSIERLQ